MKLKKYTEELYDTPVEQVLCGRGIPQDQIETWLNAGWPQINDWNLLDNIEDAVYKVYETIIKDNDIIVVVDCDLDGYTSASIFINYLDNYFPDYCEHKIRWLHHEGKQHGLSDVIDQILEMDKTEEYLVVCPDSASNDLEEHKIIYSDGGMVITLD